MRKPFIIAEIAQGYEGNEKLVELYVKAAASSGADAIKFQIFYADELALPDYKYYKLFKSLELPFRVWKKAVARSHQNGLEFYSDIFGTKSLKNLESIGVDGYKIHTTDINNNGLLRSIARTRKKVFLSSGGCQTKEIEMALSILEGSNIVLMYGFQGEPTKLRDNNLNRINTLKNLFKIPVGFQDHTAGDSEFAFYVSFIAVGVGAIVLEKHLTLSRQAQIEDFISALTPEEFGAWSHKIKGVYASLGKKEWILSQSEREYRIKVHRAVCSLRNINKGKFIKQADIILKRTNNLNAISDLSKVLGRKVKRSIKKNSIIEEESIL